jgi:hypothetical protein
MWFRMRKLDPASREKCPVFDSTTIWFTAALGRKPAWLGDRYRLVVTPLVF